MGEPTSTSGGQADRGTDGKLTCRRSAWKKWLWWGLVAFWAVTIAGRIWWGQVAQSRLDAALAEARQVGPLEWKDLLPPPVPDDQNAVVAYEVAFRTDFFNVRGKAPGRTPRQQRLSELSDMVSDLLDDDYRREHPQEVQEILQEAAIPLACARVARSMDGVDWKLPVDQPLISIDLRNMARFRHLARLLCLAASAAHDAGRDDEAVQYLLDTLAAGDVLKRSPHLIGQLVGIAVDALAAGAVEAIAPRLQVGDGAGAVGPSQVTELVRILADGEKSRQAFVFGMLAERAMAFDTCERFRDGLIRMDDNGLIKTGGKWSRVIWVMDPMFMLDEAHLIRFHTQTVRAAKEQTFHATMAKWPDTEADQIEGRLIHARLLSAILIPSIGKMPDVVHRAAVMRKMAAVRLAMRVYELDHGRLPESLGELVPGYLPRLPEDTFSATLEPLRYLPDADRPLLYSVGPNGQDDKGMFATTQSGAVIEDRSPDIVFFINGDRPKSNHKRSATSTAPATLPATSSAQPASD